MAASRPGQPHRRDVRVGGGFQAEWKTHGRRFCRDPLDETRESIRHCRRQAQARSSIDCGTTPSNTRRDGSRSCQRAPSSKSATPTWCGDNRVATAGATSSPSSRTNVPGARVGGDRRRRGSRSRRLRDTAAATDRVCRRRTTLDAVRRRRSGRRSSASAAGAHAIVFEQDVAEAEHEQRRAVYSSISPRCFQRYGPGSRSRVRHPLVAGEDRVDRAVLLDRAPPAPRCRRGARRSRAAATSRRGGSSAPFAGRRRAAPTSANQRISDAGLGAGPAHDQAGRGWPGSTGRRPARRRTPATGLWPT